MSNGRKVSTDALETLGMIIDDTQKRDAIHLAVLPMVAGEHLPPGECIKVKDGVAISAPYEKATGIVDPFLPMGPHKGERFWMVLYPRMVTSLRHVWSHPSFDDEATAQSERSKAVSEAWLRAFCAKGNCPSYEEMISLIGGDADGEGGGYLSARIEDGSLHFCGTDAYGEIPPEFWDHLEVVMGRKFPNRPSYFSCSC